MTVAKKKAVAVVKKSLVATEAEIKDLSLYAVEEGQEEHLSQDELEMPFLKLYQKMSKMDIDGIKPGLFYNTVSEEIYGDAIKIQVHGYFHNYTKWMGKKGNGEYRGAMTTEEFRIFEKKAEPALEREGGDMVHTVDNEILRYTDTHNFIVSLPEYPEEGIMIYPLASTGCKVARKWNSLQNSKRVNGKPAKRYATLWELVVGDFKSNDGFDYNQVKKIISQGLVAPDLLKFGKDFEDFAQTIKNQGVKYDDESETTSADESEF
jgi:hypothetical protein